MPFALSSSMFCDIFLNNEFGVLSLNSKPTGCPPNKFAAPSISLPYLSTKFSYFLTWEKTLFDNSSSYPLLRNLSIALSSIFVNGASFKYDAIGWGSPFTLSGVKTLLFHSSKTLSSSKS